MSRAGPIMTSPGSKIALFTPITPGKSISQVPHSAVQVPPAATHEILASRVATSPLPGDRCRPELDCCLEGKQSFDPEVQRHYACVESAPLPC